MKVGATLLILLLSASALLCISSIDADTTDDGAVTDATVYTVNYRLNGGTLPDDTPRTYVSGSYMELPTPVMDGYWFAGWHTEKGLTNPVGGIVPELRGHITLYAKWIPDKRVGMGWDMDVSGSYWNGNIKHTVSGSVESGYDMILDGEALLREGVYLRYAWPDGSFVNQSTSHSWISSLTDGWRFLRSERYDDGRLTVWQSGDTTMWVKDLLYPVKITAPISGGEITYTLDSTFKYRPNTSFHPNVSAEYPVTVNDVGRMTVGEDLELTASGEDFAGWYLNGSLVSEERTVKFTHLTPSDRIVAKTIRTFTVVTNGVEVNDMGFEGAAFYDSEGNRIIGISRLDPGLYLGEVTKGGVRNSIDFVVEGWRMFTQEWEFQGREYSLSVKVPYSEMCAHVCENPHLPRFSQRTQAHVEAFYTPDDTPIREIHSILSEYGKGMDRVTYASFVLRFVQSIPYIEDIDSRGEDEFWKFPIETLWDGGGDCEDTTFLYGTLMGMSDYRTSFILFRDHAMAGITLDAEGYVTEVDGYGFLFCETISTAFGIGQSTADHHPEDVIFSCRVESI